MADTPNPRVRVSVIDGRNKGCLHYLFMFIVLSLVSFAACAVLPFLVPAPEESSKLEERAPDETQEAPARRTWIEREGIR